MRVQTSVLDFPLAPSHHLPACCCPDQCQRKEDTRDHLRAGKQLLQGASTRNAHKPLAQRRYGLSSRVLRRALCAALHRRHSLRHQVRGHLFPSEIPCSQCLHYKASRGRLLKAKMVPGLTLRLRCSGEVHFQEFVTQGLSGQSPRTPGNAIWQLQPQRVEWSGQPARYLTQYAPFSPPPTPPPPSSSFTSCRRTAGLESLH